MVRNLWTCRSDLNRLMIRALASLADVTFPAIVPSHVQPRLISCPSRSGFFGSWRTSRRAAA